MYDDEKIQRHEDCPGVGRVRWYVRYVLPAADTSARALKPIFDAAMVRWQQRYDLGVTCERAEFRRFFHASPLGWTPGRLDAHRLLLRQGSNVFETYWTTRRGVEAIDNSFRLLELSVYGRPSRIYAEPCPERDDRR